MVKFTSEDKLAAVQQYLEGKGTYASIGASIGTSENMVRTWAMLYEHHGEEAFKISYTSYTAQFKIDVLNYMNNHGTSSNETAAIFKISSPASIRKWRIQFATQGLDALEPKKKGRPTMKKETIKVTPAERSIEALQEEIVDLRMEIAYLKKLNALVQSKEKLQSKTKLK